MRHIEKAVLGPKNTWYYSCPAGLRLTSFIRPSKPITASKPIKPITVTKPSSFIKPSKTLHFGFERSAFSYRQASIPTKHLTKTKTDPYGSAFVFGADRDRTDYLLNAIQSL